MVNTQATKISQDFSKESIDLQLKKILSNPAFADSDILKRFLVFVVNETLNGNANCVKEYTIAVNVLGKPAQFKPQENGIVRIHAGRLRRALKQYYTQEGNQDPIYINIPKGKYVPSFSNFKFEGFEEADETFMGPVSSRQDGQKAQPVIAILPISHPNNSELASSLAEGLGMQLSNGLIRTLKASVISPQAVQNLVENRFSIKDFTKALRADYYLSGTLQATKDRMRVSLQMIKSENFEQVWGDMFERTINSSSLFQIQDEIMDLVVSAIRKLNLYGPKLARFERTGKQVMAAV